MEIITKLQYEMNQILIKDFLIFCLENDLTQIQEILKDIDILKRYLLTNQYEMNILNPIIDTESVVYITIEKTKSRCQGMTKNGEYCVRNAKFNINGKVYCGIHKNKLL